MKKVIVRTLLAGLMLSLAACSSPMTTREKGAGIGVVGGAAAGGILGSTVGHAGAGAGIGAVFGGIFGWLFGDQLQGREHQQNNQQLELEQNQRELEKQRREIEQLECLRTQRFNRELCTY